jgi:hypothetical protein
MHKFKVAPLRLRAQFIIALPRTRAKVCCCAVKVVHTSSKLHPSGCTLNIIVAPLRLCAHLFVTIGGALERDFNVDASASDNLSNNIPLSV